jgi:hypothetical protein
MSKSDHKHFSYGGKSVYINLTNPPSLRHHFVWKRSLDNSPKSAYIYNKSVASQKTFLIFQRLNFVHHKFLKMICLKVFFFIIFSQH